MVRGISLGSIQASEGVQRKTFKGWLGYRKDFLGLGGKVINSDSRVQQITTIFTTSTELPQLLCQSHSAKLSTRPKVGLNSMNIVFAPFTSSVASDLYR